MVRKESQNFGLRILKPRRVDGKITFAYLTEWKSSITSCTLSSRSSTLLTWPKEIENQEKEMYPRFASKSAGFPPLKLHIFFEFSLNLLRLYSCPFLVRAYQMLRNILHYTSASRPFFSPHLARAPQVSFLSRNLIAPQVSFLNRHLSVMSVRRLGALTTTAPTRSFSILIDKSEVSYIPGEEPS
jgi:hypothetical protein